MGKTLHLTDFELTERIRKGDHDAFRQIYERYRAVLYMHTYKMLHDEHSALDVIQDVFTDLWLKGENLQIKESLKAYLYSAVRYRTLDVLRKSSQHDKFLSSMVEFAKENHHITEDDVNLREFISRMEAEIARLPPRMREIFELSRFAGKSHRTIADELAITDHTVKKTLNRTLRILRSKLTSILATIL